ncbi:MAG: hypothetical protein AAF618_00270 [Pseudomonadota bacterium]
MEEARRAWRENAGQEMPEWVAVMITACEASSQAKVARRLGVTGGALSQITFAKYQANLAAMEDRVRAVLMATDVECPVLRQISSADCLEWRREVRTLTSTHPIHIRMHRACAVCPHNPAAAQPAAAERDDQEDAA